MEKISGKGSVFLDKELVAKVSYSLFVSVEGSGQESIRGSIKVIDGGDNFQTQNQFVFELQDHNRKFLIQFKKPHPVVADPNYQIIINSEITN